MKLFPLAAVLLTATGLQAQTMPITFADLSADAQAKLVAEWKKNFKSEVSAVPPGQAAKLAAAKAATVVASVTSGRTGQVPATTTDWGHPADLGQHLVDAHGMDRVAVAKMTEREMKDIHNALHWAEKNAGTGKPAPVAQVQQQFPAAGQVPGYYPQTGQSSGYYPQAGSYPQAMPGYSGFGGYPQCVGGNCGGGFGAGVQVQGPFGGGIQFGIGGGGFGGRVCGPGGCR